MQLLAYTESKYSSNLVRTFVSVLDQSDLKTQSCEVTVIFNEQSAIGWSSPVVVTIKNSVESGLVISSQRFYKAGSRNNGRSLFIQIQKDIKPTIIAVARVSLSVAEELQDILPTDEKLILDSCDEKLITESGLMEQLKSQLDQEFCFYQQQVEEAQEEIRNIPERRKNYSGTRTMSDHSIIQFIR
ncbi:MAG: hypothetical protein L3J46_06860 [Kangiellaceae bacterium]|nr:hypothetical protein [Kangiellaceae bacterium]